MKNNLLALSLGIAVTTYMLVPSNAFANFNATFTPPSWNQIIGIFSPAMVPGTKQEFETAKNTKENTEVNSRIERDTTPQAPSLAGLHHAKDIADKLRSAHLNNVLRAIENRSKRPEIRKDRKKGQDDNETAATSRTQKGTDSWSAQAPRLLTAALDKKVRGLNRTDDASTDNPLLRIDRLIKGPACKAADVCGLTFTQLSPRDKFALFMARACNSLGICDQYGGTTKDIAMLRGKLGLPMFAALEESGKLKAIPIQATSSGGGDEDTEGSAIWTNKFKTMEGCKVQAGNCTDAVLTAGLIRVDFVAPDMKPASINGDSLKQDASYRVVTDDGRFVKAALYGGRPAGKDNKNIILVEGVTQVAMRTIPALQKQAEAGEALNSVACMVGGALQPSQKGPNDDKSDNLMSKAGTPRKDTSPGYSERQRKKLDIAQVKQRDAGSDSEAKKPAERQDTSEDGRAKASKAADDKSKSGQGCPPLSTLAASGNSSEAADAGPLKLFTNPTVIAWMNDLEFTKRVIAFRTVLPEIYLAENQDLYDPITTAAMTDEFGPKYAMYALAQKEREEEYQLSMNNQMKMFGIDPKSYLPVEIAQNFENQYAVNALKLDAEPKLPTYVADIVPDIDTTVQLADKPAPAYTKVALGPLAPDGDIKVFPQGKSSQGQVFKASLPGNALKRIIKATPIVAKVDE